MSAPEILKIISTELHHSQKPKYQSMSVLYPRTYNYNSLINLLTNFTNKRTTARKNTLEER